MRQIEPGSKCLIQLAHFRQVCNPLVNFIPKYFLGEQFNPSCDICDPGDFDDDILTELNPSLDP
jgi:hypothetical protein